MSFDQLLFNNFIIDQKVIGFFDQPITLKSGRLSNYYVNWRQVTSDVFLIDQISQFVIDFCRDKQLNPDCFYGVPEGATKLGVITQYKWAHQFSDLKKGSHILPMGRSKPKQHGASQDKFFVGKPQGKIILLEDVTTTGQSMLAELDRLLSLNLNVIACIGLTNRLEIDDEGKSVSQKVKERYCMYYSLSNSVELFKELNAKFNMSKSNREAIQEECFKFCNINIEF